MNIISNDCIGGRVYNEYNSKYENPFIWSCITTDDFIYLMDNFYSIDFYNIKCEFSNEELYNNKNIPQIIIDGKICLQFIHHHQDEKYSEPTKTSDYKYSVDIYYNDILNYLKDSYIRRVNRMISLKEEPIFIYSPSVGKYVNNSYDSVINSNNDFKKIICCSENTVIKLNDKTKRYNYHFETGKQFELTQNIAKHLISEKFI